MEDLFDIISNDSKKQFEFISKSDMYTSYTVSYNECDNLKDAKLAVLAAVQSESERNVNHVLERFGLDPVYIGNKGREIAEKYFPNTTKQ